jgi:predicted N-formylglutamate amidohydrolase
MAPALLLTCEHGGNQVPAAYRTLFYPAQALLQTHRGLDLGAAQAARSLARRLQAPLLVHCVSRLVIDLNRSLHHPKVFSNLTLGLPQALRTELIDSIYLPHRRAVWRALQDLGGPAVHLALHSFTPVLFGAERRVDIGLLYDPRRRGEVLFARHLRTHLQRLLPELKIRYNAPYRGSADGLTTALRLLRPPITYLGLEIELNQKHVGTPLWPKMLAALAQATAQSLTGHNAAATPCALKLPGAAAVPPAESGRGRGCSLGPQPPAGRP